MNHNFHTGDSGYTRNFAGSSTSKSDPIIAGIGEIDELNAWLGLIRYIIKSPEKTYLNQIQHQLMSYMSILSGFTENKSYITTGALDFLIEKYAALAPAPRNFIVPGDQEIPTFINLARAVCRRCERQLVICQAEPPIIMFFNRLSTFLFHLQIYYQT
jgi:cob(I)alamin adenosyltransferase